MWRRRGESGGRFRDRSATAGVGGPTLKLTGWGCGLVDLDHDRDLDLVAVHGRVARSEPPPGAVSGEFWNDYAEPNRVFVNDSGRLAVASYLAQSGNGYKLVLGDHSQVGVL